MRSVCWEVYFLYEKCTFRCGRIACRNRRICPVGNTGFCREQQKLTDDADIITSSQEETIENNLKKCTLATGWDTIIYTNNNNVDSYDMEDYCNDYFDNHNYGCGDKKAALCSL